MNIQSQSHDRLAKLLATENISVVRDNVPTASFDIKNRTLILPRWKNMTTEVEEMLMLHEVGHALYTKLVDYGVVFKEKRHLAGYANIIEDVRIEKKMKERYPGSRKSFNMGYRELHERDFFELKNRDLSDLLLIDKINLYYKVGYDCGVSFTHEEQELLAKVDQCRTVEDVIKLAEEIFNFSKQQIEEELELSLIELEAVDGGMEGNEGAEASEPIHELSDYKELEATTMEAFDSNLNAEVDSSYRLQYYDAEFEYEYTFNNIIPYRIIMSELHDDDKMHLYKYRGDKFKSATAPVVNYLVKEFEMRKSATSYKRAKISKIGQLDSKKLFAYKLKDDLFKQVLRVEEGKKHGMIFLLDWSGSMCNCIEETLEQVLNLAMFCQRIQIPYQVFAFTDGYDVDMYKYKHKRNSSGLSSNDDFALLELFSHKMTSVEFNKMIGYLVCSPWNKRKYGLNGTPLNTALLFMTKYVGKFIRDNQVEKMSFITLTDGDGSTLQSSGNRIINGPTYDAAGKRINQRSILKDNITKKDYPLASTSAEQTSILLEMVRDRWHAKTIGFFLMNNSYRKALEFVRHNVHGLQNNQSHDLAENINEQLRKNKFCVLDNVPGRDEFYILPNVNKVEYDTEIEVDDTMNAGQLSRELTKVFTRKMTSRVLLSKFIDQVS